MSVNKESIQALLSARLINQRSADFILRLLAGETASAIIASAPKPTGTPASSAAAPRPAPTGEPSKTITFFGNLAYSIDDPKLAEILKGYKLATPARVSRRQDGRSLGFALINFESQAEQTRAIAAFNNKDVEGRPLNVAPSTRGPRVPSSAAGAAGSAPRSSFPRSAMAPRSPASAPLGQAPRQRPPRVPASGEASKTTVFVANLPYIVDDAGLLQIFEGFQVKEAHIPRRRNGMSTGYGFVTLSSDAEANRAIKEVDKSVVEKREISVRASFNRPPAAAAPAPAAASAAPQ